MSTFKEQSGGSLGSATNCPSCYVAFNVCYSAINDTQLCCVASLPVTVYAAPGSQWTDANLVIYDASDLQNPAAAGYYSDDVTTCSIP